MRPILVILLLPLALSSCVSWQIDSALTKYRAVTDQIELGDSKDKVLGILLPTQESLSQEARKSPDKFVQNGRKIEIYYMRSGWVEDGRTTDDEFTPYVFEDGKLTAIGWQALGGPKIVSQPPPPPSETTVIQQKPSPKQTHCIRDLMGNMNCTTY